MNEWQTLAAEPANQKKSVFSVQRNGQTYWIKRGAKKVHTRLQRIQCRNRASFGGEAEALRALKQRHMAVPEIMFQDSEIVVLSDVGIDIQRWLHQCPSDFARQHMVARVAHSLHRLHAQGGWHGNAAMRNFSWHEHQVYMMDFADTAHPGWSLRMKQAYDVWMALYSLGRQRNGALLTRQWLRSYPVRFTRLKLAAWAMSPLVALLRPFKGHLKRDISQGIVALEALLWF